MKKYITLSLWGIISQLLFLHINAYSQCINTYPNIETFEGGPVWTSGGANNDWAWGTPAHPTINTAGGGTKSWCVGGLSGSFYAFSEQCWIQSPCYNFTTLNYPWVSFKIFWENERQWDGMVLQSSINGGATWQNVGAFGDPVDCNTANWFNYGNITWLNSLPAAQRQGWSGRIGATAGPCTGGFGSGGWLTAKHCLVGLANQPNVIFRFLMGSGTTCNSYDGQAIDDFTISDGIPHAPTFTVNCNNFTAINPPCPTVSSYTWNFGDPLSGAANISNIANPTHVFSSPGTYSVTLSVSGGQCNPPASITQTVSASSFTAPPLSQSVTCFGGNNGSGTITPSGAGPFSYTWSPTGGNAATATGLTAGTYSIQIKDGNNCIFNSTVSIIQPPLLTAAVTSSNVTCNGGTNGSATVTAAGGTPGYTYTWSPSGGNVASATGLGAGSYTVTVKDVNNCTITAVANITQPALLTAALTSSNVSCNGGTNGSATVTAAGGTPGYTYTWSPSGGNVATATGLGAGSYTVTVKDVNNCTITAVANITQPPLLTAALTPSNVTCNGAANGSATVTAAGGTPGYTYTWSPSGGNAAIATGLAPGNYTVTIKDVNNCTITAVANITQPPLLTAALTSSNVTCNGAANGSATVTAAGGTPGYTYTWSPSGGNAAIATGLAPGNYTVTIKDVNNCTVTAVAIITQPTLLTAAITSSNVTCNGAANGSATVTAGGGTPGYTYTWSPSGGNAAIATGLAPGSYTVTIKDINNCTVTAVAVITQPTLLTAAITSSNATCGMLNGGATVTAAGGTPGYTYTWTPLGGNAATATGLGAGNYTIIVKDLNNCTVTAVAVINQPVSMTTTINVTNVACNGGTNGSATVAVTGGTSPYTYTWSPVPGAGQGTSIASGLSAQNYSVTIKDNMGCSTVAIASITQPPLLTAALTSSNVTCNGAANGSATVTAAGGSPGYTYTWTPSGGNAATATGLGAGNYTVTVKDANNCTITAVANITQPPLLTAALTSSNVTCNGAANGSATVTAAGGSPGYTYTWTPLGGNAATASGLGAGNYTVTVKDANNCTVTAIAIITQPSLLTAALTSSNVSCNGGTNGSATVTAGGGTPGYTYTWTPVGGNAASATGLGAGSYTVTVKDVNNCTITAVANITQPPLLTAALASSNVTCNGAANGSATVTAAGGTPGYIYTWSPSGGNAAIATGLAPGNYTVTIKDVNNCTVTANAVITQPAAIVITATNTGPYCAGSTIQLNTGAATSYTWNGPSAFTSNNQNPNIPGATIAMSGTYSVIVTVGTCTASATTNVAVNSLPTPTATNTSPVCTGQPIIFSGAGATTYTWTGPAGFNNTNQNPMIAVSNAANAGTYTLTVTDANGCTNFTTTNVVVNPLPIPIIGSNSPVCLGSNLNLTSGGGNTYSWSGPNGFVSGLQNPTIVGTTTNNTGVYTVTVTSLAGCVSTASLNISILTATTTATNTGPYCVGTTIQLNTPATVSYTWTGPGGFTSNAQNPTLALATLAMGGTYSVIVSAGTCTASATTLVIINSLPTPTATNTSPVCAGQTINFMGSGALTYTWTGPAAFNSTTQNPNILAATAVNAGTYTLIVTDVNGCTNFTTTNVVVNPLPIIAVNNPTVCVNQTINLSANGGAGYSWSGPLAFTSNLQNPSLVNAVTAMSGVYTVTVTSIAGCTNTANSNVVVLPTPNPAIISNTPCVGTSLNLSGSGGVLYAWTGPNGFISAAQNPNINNVSILAAGSYTLLVSSGSCTASITGNIIVNPLPTPNIINNSPICVGTPITFTGSGGSTYLWSGPAGFSNPTQNPTIPSAAISNGGTYTLTVTDANNCVNSITSNVTINPPPIASATGTNVCENSNANLSANGGVTYNWSGPGGFISNNQNPVIAGATLANAGQYTVVVSGANSCTNSAVTNIGINPVPVPTIMTNGPLCINTILSLAASGGISYSWTGPNGFVSAAQNPTIMASTTAVGGIYTVSVTDVNGCFATANINTIINPIPNVNIISGPNKGCAPLCITFTCISSASVQTCNWTLGNGTNFGGSNIAQTCYNTTGIYSITTSVTDVNGCQNSATYTAQVYPKPVADFNYAPYHPIVNEGNITYTDASFGANITSWNWYFMSTAQYQSNLQNPTFVYEEAGTYPITLVVKSDHGCIDTAIRVIVVGEDFGIYVPNAFTPNSDGLNDGFQPKGYGIVKYQLRIFDRWGEELFYTEDFYNPWDGIYHGKLSQEGVYVWKINVVDIFSKAHEYTGHVTLLQ